MATSRVRACIGVVLLLPLVSGAAAAQGPGPQGTPQEATGSGPPTNPWDDRPVCASMFLKSEWQLSPKQRTCDWIQNGVFSSSAMFTAAVSARFSQMTDAASERGDGFTTRFGRKFGQHAAKSSGAFLGALVFREDQRRHPPFLALRATRPRGFWRRTGHALLGNLVAYRCDGSCRQESDIERVFALSRVTGALASGFAGELMTTDRPDSRDRALRGAASAYATPFVTSVFAEFTPELSGAANKIFRGVFGGR